MGKFFEDPTLTEAPNAVQENPIGEGPVAPVGVKQNPCITIFKYRDRWAVKPNSGDNFIFPTLGQALNEAKLMLTEYEDEV